MTRQLVARLAAAGLLLSLTACGGGGIETADADDGASLRLPSQIVGLRVQPESIDPEDLEQIDRPYVDSVAVFSMREDDLLRATIQIARFNRAARPDDETFQASIIGLLGGQRSFELLVGDTVVNTTTGTSQNIFSWFAGRGMFVLAVQQDYEFPRTLLRRLIDLELEL